MKRVSFKMKLKPGFEDEYKKRHDQLWPEMRKVLADAGVSDYSIYLDKDTHILFAFQKVSDDNTAEKLPDNPVVKKWWAYMKDIMDTNPDNSPVQKVLEEVFHMD